MQKKVRKALFMLLMVLIMLTFIAPLSLGFN